MWDEPPGAQFQPDFQRHRPVPKTPFLRKGVEKVERKEALQTQESLPSRRRCELREAPGGAQTTTNPQIWGLCAKQCQQLMSGCFQRHFGAGGLWQGWKYPHPGAPWAGQAAARATCLQQLEYGVSWSESCVCRGTSHPWNCQAAHRTDGSRLNVNCRPKK